MNEHKAVSELITALFDCRRRQTLLIVWGFYSQLNSPGVLKHLPITDLLFILIPVQMTCSVLSKVQCCAKVRDHPFIYLISSQNGH